MSPTVGPSPVLGPPESTSPGNGPDRGIVRSNTDTAADNADSDSEHDRSPPWEISATSAFPVSESLSPRDLVRLFQCRVCSLPLREPVCLPCGYSMCQSCTPATHRRVNISYPADPTRLRGFRCPMPDCQKEHALEDCAVDVVLNKATELLRDEMDTRKRDAARLGVSTWVSTQDPWATAGISSLRDYNDRTRVVPGGKLVATYTLAEDGRLQYEEDSSYDHVSPPSEDGDSDEDYISDEQLMVHVQDMTRAEMDCQVCYALFCDPLTTACGHTFCRSCLHRILDHSQYCPVCRRSLALNLTPLLDSASCPSNEALVRILNSFWPDEVEARREAVAAENDAGQMDGFDFPLFVCTLAFPRMPTFLHVFEPRYRLMIRRALEGDRTFGMVLPNPSRGAGEPEFLELGTLLRIVNVQYYPDGRSLIETVGLSRFRVLRHGSLDGYVVGKTERVDDVSLQEEEAREAVEMVEATPRESTGESSAESSTEPSTRNTLNDDDNNSNNNNNNNDNDDNENKDDPTLPTSIQDLETMSTKHLMSFASGFVTRMRSQSVPWLAQRSVYGECPSDPAVFPWWFASMLPVKDLQKYRLLETSSVRQRLKICCAWIIEWEASRW